MEHKTSMPHIEIKHSNDICFDHKEIFQALESQFNQFDPSTGDCKSRIYPSTGDCKSRIYPSTCFYHSHVAVDAYFLNKPSRGRVYVESIINIIKNIMKKQLPKDIWLSIGFHFSSASYFTGKL